jgi:UDP-N-acetylglucosamine 4,6-dehydratase/5-epimerase
LFSNLSDRVTRCVEGKTLLITGGAGTIGSALLNRLVRYPVKAIRLLDHDEERSFYLEMMCRQHPRVRVLLGDIRDRGRMMRAMQGVDIVIHAAALKHVELGEYNPFEVVSTNLMALQSLLELAIDCDVGRFVFTSSDKAVNPTNVMGGSKFIGERLVSAANAYRGLKETLFCCTRFGNVLHSAGSVVPVFERQIAQGGPLTITEPEMTRFFMSLEEAVDLVLGAMTATKGGEIFIPKMSAIRLMDLAEAMMQIHAPGQTIPWQRIGLRSGEKLYEELITEHELPRCLETERLLIVLPYCRGGEFSVDEEAVRLGPDDYPDQPTWSERLFSSRTTTPLDRGAVRHLLDVKQTPPVLSKPAAKKRGVNGVAKLAVKEDA